LAESYLFVGNPEDAEREARRVLSLDPAFPLGGRWLAWSLSKEHRYAEAIAMLQREPLANDANSLCTLAGVDAAAR
jgi:predicted Zn-dependent protease